MYFLDLMSLFICVYMFDLMNNNHLFISNDKIVEMLQLHNSCIQINECEIKYTNLTSYIVSKSSGSVNEISLKI